MIDTAVDLGGLKMPTFLATASGTFGYGFEYVGAVDYSKLGAVTAKGIRGATEPESVHNTCIDEMARLGFDLIPMVSTYCTKNVGIEAEAPDLSAAYCEKAIPKKQLKGYIFGPWTLTAPGIPRDKYMASLPVVENMFKHFGH